MTSASLLRNSVLQLAEHHMLSGQMIRWRKARHGCVGASSRLARPHRRGVGQQPAGGARLPLTHYRTRGHDAAPLVVMACRRLPPSLVQHLYRVWPNLVRFYIVVPPLARLGNRNYPKWDWASSPHQFLPRLITKRSNFLMTDVGGRTGRIRPVYGGTVRTGTAA